MDSSRWQQIKKVLDSALPLAVAERSSYLKRVCSDDPQLLQEVQSLISTHEKSGDDFLKSSWILRGFQLTPGTRVGAYEIISLVGAGAMGEVYCAEDRRLHRRVAVKVLLPPLSLDSNHLSRFEQEARAAAALNHPNILAVYDVGTHGDCPYLVSELLEGETLRERLQSEKSPLDPEQVMDYVLQIGRGLAAAHGKGIVHRDLKPENLFLTTEGYVKILDFGLAKLSYGGAVLMESASVQTAVGTLVGTLAYMSPEQIRGQDVDARADIWSWGIVFYEALFGRRPFEAETHSDLLAAILKQEPKLPTHDKQLKRFFAKSLAKEAGQRYTNMREALDDLGCISLRELSMSRSSRGGRLGRWTMTQIRDSWAGQLAGYCGAVAGAILAYQKLAGPLQGSPWWMRVILISSFPFAVFLFHGIPALVERRRLKQLAEISGQIHSGYFRLSPRDDESSFVRADSKHHEILRWLEQRMDSVLYLTGVSGSGKSSLLTAWVLPQLVRQKTLIIRLRGHQDLVAAFAREMQGMEATWQNAQPETQDVRALVERISRQIRPQRMLIVVDQFEEFVILQNTRRHRSLEQFLNSLRKDPIQGVTFLFVARSDYIGLIEKLGLPPLLQNANWQEVPPFTEIAARDFVRGSGLQVREELLRGVLREAAEIDQTKGLIRPITINLCGLVLGRFATELPHGFRPGGMIRGFLRESVSLPAICGIAPRLIPHLISNYLTKRPRTITELAQSTGAEPAEIRGCLRVLGQSDRAIVRPVDADQQTWEISHDFLVPLLESIVARWTTSFRRRLRPWLPWIAAFALAVVALVGSSWNRGPIAQLEELGWQTSTNGAIFEFQFEGIPPKESTSVLKHVGSEFHVTLARATPRKDIRDNLSEISEWRVLKRLSALNVIGLQVTDVSPLSNLTNLASLRLSNEPVRDVSALKSLTNLSSLDLSLTSVTDVSPLKDLKNLRSLDLHSTPVSDLSPLKDLTSLSSIELSDMPLRDISPLRNLRNLSSIYLMETPVRDLSPLKDLTNLDILDLSFTQVSDLTPLKDLKNLSNLDLHATRVTDVAMLKNLTSLSTLNLSFCQVRDVTALKDLVNLSFLDLTLTRVHDVSALRNIEHLSIRNR